MSNSNKVKDHKMKGLLKGLRYISQIFENEKEPEMQIGLPTDVKHVAHIGWDGPSVNSPSWMNEFKGAPGFSSAPLNPHGDINNKEPDKSVKWASEDSSRKGSRSVNSQGPDLPKSSRRQSTGGVTDSPTKEKSEKPKSRRPKSKDSSDGSRHARQPGPPDSFQGSDSPARSIPDVPKKSRRKKSKDGSTKSRLKDQSGDSNLSDLGSPSGSESKSRYKQRPFDD